MSKEKALRVRIFGFGLFLSAAICLFDVMMPLGVAGGVPYVAVVLLGLWSSKPRDVYVLALLVSGLTLGGYYLSPPTDDLWKAQLNRGLALAAIWGVAILGERLRTGSLLYKAVFESAADGIIVLDAQRRISGFSRSAEQIFGYCEAEVLGKSFELLHPPEVRDVVKLVFEGLHSRAPSRTRAQVDVLGRRRDGSIFPLRLAASEMGVDSKLFHSVVLRDISERKAVETQLRKLSRAVEQSASSIIIADLTGTIEYVNPSFCEASGYTAEEVIGQNTRFLNSGHTSGEAYKTLWQTISRGGEWRGEFHNRKKNGEHYWVDARISPIKDGSEITHFLAVEENITIRKEYEERLLHQSNYDELTGLPNRVLAQDRVSRALMRCQQNNKSVVLMIIDLDQFKVVNDTLGHSVGDKLLREAASRLQDVVEPSDTVARLSGDEFLIILPDLYEVTRGEMVAQDILKALEEPFMLDGQELIVTASIGLSVAPDDGVDRHILLQDADAALTLAKTGGRNTYRFFKPHMNEESQRRLELVTQLRHALERDELYLQYQPLFDLTTDEMIGMEALLRWQNPELGFVPPDRFISLAEDSGLIEEIGGWVLDRACSDLKALRKRGHQSLKVAVNVSARQFQNPYFYRRVANVLANYDLPSDCLELEVTEGLLMSEDPAIVEMLARISDMGVSLSIDDFGTGYSALSYLKRYPFDVLKIDRAFVQDVTIDSQNAALSTAIIAMAHGLGLKVVAEGVETVEQLAFLLGNDCDIVQGYLYSKPLSFGAMTVFLDAQIKQEKALSRLLGAA